MMNLALKQHGLPVTLVASCLETETRSGLLYYGGHIRGQAWLAIDDVSRPFFSFWRRADTDIGPRTRWREPLDLATKS